LRNVYVIFLILALSFPVLGCISGNGDDSSETKTLPSTVVAVDGTIMMDEYEGQTSFTGGRFILYWRFEDDNVIFGMLAMTDGMLALGIDPESGMKGADMYIGWVDDEGTSLFDCHSTGTTGPHPSDIELGGTEDIIEYAGTEEDGITTIEFKRSIDPQDPYDKMFSNTDGTYVIWAISGQDSLTASHSDRGGGNVNEPSGNVGEY